MVMPWPNPLFSKGCNFKKYPLTKVDLVSPKFFQKDFGLYLILIP